MTRSSKSQNSPQVVKKRLTGVSHKDAVIMSLPFLPVPKEVDTRRRSGSSGETGRKDGKRWKATSFICGERVDGLDSYHEHDTDEGERYTEEKYAAESGCNHTAKTEHVVFILDIAKPAKPKGIAKDFEVVEGVRKVIFLDDEGDWGRFSEEDEWEEWEKIYSDSETSDVQEVKRPAYSTVLQKKR
ncbi:hypothetical protein BDP27DRAFT_1312202 [Rhodocollybia butyracea]|uniref:Uncharacterized protein n=1 Tax=Rhodocollybia butyracea TaxID=206335 RepID=A0A9P5Q2S4_9AGAR|nr:hypothetical protein BDP27DRAFT_1312202 [Rhodocollybia butyracea]